MKKLSVILIVSFSFLNPNFAQMLYRQNLHARRDLLLLNKPFAKGHDGAKSSFKSNEFIYGRIEFEGKTLKQAFQLDNVKEGPHYLCYHVASYKNNRQTGGTNSIWRALLIGEDQLNNTWLNSMCYLSLLRQPVNSVWSCKARVILIRWLGRHCILIITRENFPADDEYTIYTQFYLQLRDGWGNPVNDDNKWPYAEGSFSVYFQQ